jgi:glycosyltransferase involved in cell wall biosynthesis
VGVIPNRFNEFTNLNFPIRILEYIHFKIPVIVPRTKGIIDYFPEDTIFYFNPLKPGDLTSKIYFIYENKNYLNNTIEKSYKIYKNIEWEKQSKILLKVYEKKL